MHEHNNYQKAKTGAFVGLIGNVVLGILKLIVGYLGTSAALIADSFHSFSDSASSVVVLFGIDIASKPKDEEHPYGHDKAESMAGWMVSVMLICLGCIIMFNSAKDMFSSEIALVPQKLTLWIALLSIAVKEAMFQYKYRLGKKINSTSVMADAWHHRSDAISSVAAFVGILLTIYGGETFREADHFAALIIGVMILWIGVKFFNVASGELMDQIADDSVIDKVRSIAVSMSGVENVEKLIVRKSGMHFLADIHVEVNKDMSVELSHAIASEVKKKIKSSYPEVIYVLVHIEPYYEKR